MTKVIGIGDLVTDLYYDGEVFIGACGGKTFSNICANLGYMGVGASVYGVCGRDLAGHIAFTSLVEANVDTSNIIIKDISTRLFHINRNRTAKRCPNCNNKTWYIDSQIDIQNIVANLAKDDIVLIDSLNLKNVQLIQKIDNKIVIDIGYYQEFKNLSNEELIILLQTKFEIINMNERVYKYIIKRLKMKNEHELFLLLKTNLLIITKGSKGADFVLNNLVISKILSDKGSEIDSNGAGDAFFAVIIKTYIENNGIINEQMIDKAFFDATIITKKVVECLGARGHISPLNRTFSNLCLCCNKKGNIKMST